MTARYRVAATGLRGRRLIYRRDDGSYSWRRGKTGRAWMSAPHAELAKKWATRRGARNIKAYPPGRSPWLELASGAAWPTNKRLLRALNRTGQKRRRLIRIISGLRTPQEAWVLRMRYLNGRGNLAARCCSRYDRTIHSWAQCGKDPWSNHADGNAADCGTVTRSGKYTSLGLDRKAKRIFLKLGGCFPVMSPQKEWWHAEMR